MTIEKYEMGHKNFVIEVVVMPISFENVHSFCVYKL